MKRRNEGAWAEQALRVVVLVLELQLLWGAVGNRSYFRHSGKYNSAQPRPILQNLTLNSIVHEVRVDRQSFLILVVSSELAFAA